MPDRPPRPEIPPRSDISSERLTKRFSDAHDRYDRDHDALPEDGATSFDALLMWLALAGSLQYICAAAIARVRTLEEDVEGLEAELARQEALVA